MTFTTRSVANGGVGIATRDYGGDGPALVLMHGAGMEQSSLEPLAEHLRSAFRVITFDFRGHGDSDSAPWTVGAAVADLAAVCEAYATGVPAVGGHSLGGMVAAVYGSQQPTCPAVVNIDGHGRGRLDQYVGLPESDVRQVWAHQERRIEALTTGPGALVLRGLMLLLRKKPAASGETLRQVMREVDELDLFATYRELGCSLLVFNAVATEQRRAIKLWAGEGIRLVQALRKGLDRDLTALAAEKEGVDVVTLDASHMLIRTHPELVAWHTRRFLQRQPAVAESAGTQV